MNIAVSVCYCLHWETHPWLFFPWDRVECAALCVPTMNSRCQHVASYPDHRLNSGIQLGSERNTENNPVSTWIILLVCLSERKCRLKYPEAIGELRIVTAEPSWGNIIGLSHNAAENGHSLKWKAWHKVASVVLYKTDFVFQSHIKFTSNSIT